MKKGNCCDCNKEFKCEKPFGHMMGYCTTDFDPKEKKPKPVSKYADCYVEQGYDSTWYVVKVDRRTGNKTNTPYSFKTKEQAEKNAAYLKSLTI